MSFIKKLRWLWALMICMFIPAAAFAQSLEIADSIGGMQVYPQGAQQEQAVYWFRYEYPQFVAQTSMDQTINAYYQAMRDDLSAFLMPQSVEEQLTLHEPGEPSYYIDLSYQVTANTASYLSVTLTSQQFLGYSQSDRIEANVFARDGVYAGQLVSLSQVMGLEQEGDEFDARASYASQLVYKLVWKIMEEQQASQQKDFFEGLTRADAEAAFHPETDFYIDIDDNLVFFIQAGIVSSEVEGILAYPFSRAELLTAVKE